MEQFLLLFDTKYLYPFLLLFARVVSFMAFMPIFGDKAVSPNIRIALSFYFTIFLYPLVDLHTTVNDDTFLEALISEVTLGLIGSFLMHVIFAAVSIIGDLIGYATALSMANMFDPSTGTQQNVVGRFLYMIILVLYFETGMYEVTLVMLHMSFDSIHLGGFNLFAYDGVAYATEEVKKMFAFAFSFAFPLFFIGFVLDVYYGYGTKSMPAFSPFVITFQVKFILIFVFMLLGMEIFAESFKNYFINKFG